MANESAPNVPVLDTFDIDTFEDDLSNEVSKLLEIYQKRIDTQPKIKGNSKELFKGLGLLHSSEGAAPKGITIGFVDCSHQEHLSDLFRNDIFPMEYTFGESENELAIKIDKHTLFNRHILITTSDSAFQDICFKEHTTTYVIKLDENQDIVSMSTYKAKKKVNHNIYFYPKNMVNLSYKNRNISFDALQNMHKEMYQRFSLQANLHHFGNTFKEAAPTRSGFQEASLSNSENYYPFALKLADPSISFQEAFVEDFRQGTIGKKIDHIRHALGARTFNTIANATGIVSTTKKYYKTTKRFLKSRRNTFTFDTEVFSSDESVDRFFSTLVHYNLKTRLSLTTLNRLRKIVTFNKMYYNPNRQVHIDDLNQVQKSFLGKLRRVNDDYDLNLEYHQLFAVLNTLPYPVSILKMDVGLGKTRSAIAYAMTRGAKQTLFVTEPGNVLELEREFKEQLKMGDITKIIKKREDLEDLKQFNLISYTTLKKVIKKSELIESDPIEVTLQNTHAGNSDYTIDIYAGLQYQHATQGGNNLLRFRSPLKTNSLDIHGTHAFKAFNVAVNNLKEALDMHYLDTQYIASRNKSIDSVCVALNRLFNTDEDAFKEEIEELATANFTNKEASTTPQTSGYRRIDIDHKGKTDYVCAGYVEGKIIDSAASGDGAIIKGQGRSDAASMVCNGTLALYIAPILVNKDRMEFTKTTIARYYKSLHSKYDIGLTEFFKMYEKFKTKDEITMSSMIARGQQRRRSVDGGNGDAERYYISPVLQTFCYNFISRTIKASIKQQMKNLMSIKDQVAARASVVNSDEHFTLDNKTVKMLQYSGREDMLQNAMNEVNGTIATLAMCMGKYTREQERMKARAKFRTKTMATLMSKKFNTVIYDECQSLKNNTSTVAIASTHLKAKNYLFMSATPVGNHMAELASYLLIGYGPRSMKHLMDIEGRFFDRYRNNLRAGKKNYRIDINKDETKYEIDMSINQSDMMKKGYPSMRLSDLVDRNMTRVIRDDKEVVRDEAFKFDMKEYKIFSNPSPEHMQLYAAQMEIVYEAQQNGKYEDTREALSTLLNLIKISEAPHLITPDFENKLTAKQEDIVNLATQHIKRGRSVIVFTQFKDTVGVIAKALAQRVDNKIFQLGDGLTPDARFKLIDAFRKNPENGAIVGTVNNLGKGFNLACADVVIMSDVPWSPLLYTQAIGRILRPDQKGSPEVFMVMNRYMIDMYKFETIMAKINMIKKFLDKNDDITEDETTKVNYQEFIINLLEKAIEHGVLASSTEQNQGEEVLSRGI